jgi:hypothetical protein
VQTIWPPLRIEPPTKQWKTHRMISLWTVLTLAPTLILLAGVCALAVWAAGQCDPQSVLVKRLTGETEVLRNGRDVPGLPPEQS